MNFEERLKKAIERGQKTSEARAAAAAEQAVSEEELKRLHTQYRLELSEHIERCLKKLAGHFPGFQHDAILSERGWGAAVSRDDFAAGRRGARRNLFSRLEMYIRPFSPLHVLELAAKGTVRNKEIYNRNHYQRLTEADVESFIGMIDLWVLEYAELYAAHS